MVLVCIIILPCSWCIKPVHYGNHLITFLFVLFLPFKGVEVTIEEIQKAVKFVVEENKDILLTERYRINGISLLLELLCLYLCFYLLDAFIPVLCW